MAVRIIGNVPKDEMPDVEEIMWNSGATHVVAMPEGDGEFTVTGFFPDMEKHDKFKARLDTLPAS